MNNHGLGIIFERFTVSISHSTIQNEGCAIELSLCTEVTEFWFLLKKIKMR